MALNLQAKIGLDGSGFNNTMAGLESKVAGFAQSLGAAFSVGAIANFAKTIIQWGSEINDASIRLGVGTDRVQELGFAAKQSGGDLGDVALGLTRLQDGIETMRAGGPAGEKILKAFQSLGVSIDDLATAKPDELLSKISSNLAATGINSEKTAAMLDLFGKSGGKLIPILTELNQKTQEFKDGGMGITPEDIKSLDEAGDMLDKLYLKSKVIGSQSLLGLKSFFSGEALQMFFDDPGQAGSIRIKEFLLGLKQAEYGKNLPVPDYRGLPGGAPAYKGDTQEEDYLKAYDAKRKSVMDDAFRRASGVQSNQGSFLAVGNLLGRAGGIQDVANRQMDRLLYYQQSALAELKKFNSNFTKPNSVNFPP